VIAALSVCFGRILRWVGEGIPHAFPADGTVPGFKTGQKAGKDSLILTVNGKKKRGLVKEAGAPSKSGGTSTLETTGTGKKLARENS